MMDRKHFSVTVNIDGGARGNPGPAGAGVVIRTDDDQTAIYEGGLFLGRATNNVAEYSGMLAGLEQAHRLGATRVRVVSDSQLMVRQMNGVYRVKNAGLLPLYEKARRLAGRFEQCAFEFVRREQNTEADRLVNLAIDQMRNVEDAAD